MTLISQSWVSIAVGIWLSSSVFCALGLLASSALKNRAPVARVLALRASLIGVALSALLCLSLAGRVRPLWNWPAPTPNSAQLQSTLANVSDFAPPMSAPKIAPIKSDAEFSKQNSAVPIKAETSIQKSAPTVVSNIQIEKIAAALWLLGVLPVLAWMLACYFLLTRLRRRALDIGNTPSADEMRHLAQNLKIRAPQLLQSESVQGPLLCGLWRPTIVLPSDFQTQFDAPAFRAVLLHELIHLQRRDLWWSAITRLLCALLWPQVLLWFVARRLEAASEEVCDTAVIEHGCAPRDYAHCLLELAERFSPRPAERVAGAGVLPLRSALSKRVQNILDESRHHSSRVSRRARVFAALFVCISAAAPFIVGAASAKNEAPDLSSPEATVRTFVAAINAKDFDVAASCVENPLPPEDLKRLKEMSKTVDFKISIEDLNSTKASSVATVHVKTLMRGKFPDGKVQEDRAQSDLSLNHLSNQWVISSDASNRTENRNSLRFMVMAFAPPGLKQLTTWIKQHNPATITGRVLHADGTPATNMKVLVYFKQGQLKNLPGAPKNSIDLENWRFFLPNSMKHFFYRNVVTDANGRYSVPDLVAEVYEIEVNPYYRTHDTKNIEKFPVEVGYKSLSVRSKWGKAIQAPDIKLTSGTIVNVKVVDQDNDTPLKDVEITGQTAWSPTIGSVIATDSRGVSQFRLQEGKATISLGGESLRNKRDIVTKVNGVYYSRTKDIEIVVDGKTTKGDTYLALNLDLILQKGQTRNISFRLKKYVAPKPKPKAKPIEMPRGTGVLQGRAVYENGTPAARVLVVATMQKPAQLALYHKYGIDMGKADFNSIDKKISHVMGKSSITNANGEYRLYSLTTAPYNLTLQNMVNKPTQLKIAVLEGVWAKEGQVIRRSRNLVLTSGTTVTVRVIDQENNKPLPKINVFAFSGQEQEPPDITETDKNGVARLIFADGKSGPLTISLNGSSAPNTRVVFAGSNDIPYQVSRFVKVFVDGKKVPGQLLGSSNIKLDLKSGYPRSVTFSLKKHIVPQSDSQVGTARGVIRQRFTSYQSNSLFR